MKAISICQPFAHLICLPLSDQRAKRVENRTWATKHRGQLAIVSSKSKGHLQFGYDDDGKAIDTRYGLRVSDMKFGVLVGIAQVVDCLPVDEIRAGLHDQAYPWLRAHRHVEGPFCWVLAPQVRIEPAIPVTGRLGLFNLDANAMYLREKAATLKDLHESGDGQ